MKNPQISLLIGIGRPDPDDGTLPWRAEVMCQHGGVQVSINRACSHCDEGEAHRARCPNANLNEEWAKALAARSLALNLRCPCSNMIWMVFGPEHTPRLPHLSDDRELHRVAPPRSALIRQRIGMDPAHPKRVYWSTIELPNELRAILEQGRDRS